jgi:hypothetical protein
MTRSVKWLKTELWASIVSTAAVGDRLFVEELARWHLGTECTTPAVKRCGWELAKWLAPLMQPSS